MFYENRNAIDQQKDWEVGSFRLRKERVRLARASNSHLSGPDTVFDGISAAALIKFFAPQVRGFMEDSAYKLQSCSKCGAYSSKYGKRSKQESLKH